MPSEMLICAAREDLIVTVEMVNYDRVFEKQLARAGTADETDHGNQQRYRGPPHRAAIRPCFFAPYLRHQRSGLHEGIVANDFATLAPIHKQSGFTPRLYRLESIRAVVPEG